MLRAVVPLKSLPLPTPAGPKWRTPRGRAEGPLVRAASPLGPISRPAFGLAAVDSTPCPQFIGLRGEILEESHEKGHRSPLIGDWGHGRHRRCRGRPGARRKRAIKDSRWLGGRAGVERAFVAGEKGAPEELRLLLCRG